MSLLERELPPALRRWELALVCLVAWLGLVAIPVGEGGIGLSWDALNQHIYLGWVADAPRFDRDLYAAGGQSYQYPYLYWPVYKMAAAGWSGVWAGVGLATLHLLAVPPVWMLARTCMPGPMVFDAAMRSLAVAMGFMTGVVLSQFDSTSNDLMAAIPLAWAVAVAMLPGDERRSAWLSPTRCTVLSGLLAGTSVAFKLSNGPLVAFVMPLVWMLAPQSSLRARLVHLALGGVTTLLGFTLVYAGWGAALWEQFGNPVYPFYEDVFTHVRAALGWNR